jgi:hypothetical protein
VTQWSESHRTRNHILSHLRLRQPGGPGSRIYITQEQGGPVIPPGTGLIDNRSTQQYKNICRFVLLQVGPNRERSVVLRWSVIDVYNIWEVHMECCHSTVIS